VVNTSGRASVCPDGRYEEKQAVNSAGRIAGRSFDPKSRVYVKKSSERTIQRIFTARPASTTIIVREIDDWTIKDAIPRIPGTGYVSCSSFVVEN
jgi:hypothetical protein